MKKTKPSFLDWIRWCGIVLLGLGGGVPALRAADTNAPAATPPPLTPEQMFEGGTNTYNNWIELGTGGFITSGNNAQAEQNQQSSSGAFGGIQDFHYGRSFGANTTVSADGHAIFDNHDYKVGLDLENQNLGFLRFSYDEYRTYENGDGGYYPPSGAWYPLSGDALTLDHGQISFEGGLRMQNSEYMPKLTFKYTHTYRNGQEPSTIWGNTVQTASNPLRALNPSFYSIDEDRDIYQLDAAEHIKTTDFGGGLRYETGSLNNSLNGVQWPNLSYQQSVTDQSSSSYDLFGAHAFSQTWLKQNLMFSAAYSYSEVNNSFTGSYLYQPPSTTINQFDYNNLNGSSWVQDHVVNLNFYARPLKNFSIVPSVRIQKQDGNGNAAEMEVSQGTPGSGQSDQSDLEVCERLDLTYTGITNWVYYVRGEWTEGSGNLNEYGGLIPTSTQFQSIQSQMDNNRLFQKYSVGARWYPSIRLTVDAGGYYKVHDYDYNFPLDSTTNNSAIRYPAYLVAQNFETWDGHLRLTLRPLQNVSMVASYEYQWSTIHTQPDPLSGLGDAESSRMASHIVAASATWLPWSRLSLTTGFNYVWSKTETPVSDYVPSGFSAAPVLAAQNNYWMVNFSSDFVVDDKTDLTVDYYYYRANDYNNNATVGVPYGAGAEEQAVTTGIVRRITESLRLSLKYGFYHYTDDTSGGHNNFDTHLIFASMQYRF